VGLVDPVGLGDGYVEVAMGVGVGVGVAMDVVEVGVGVGVGDTVEGGVSESAKTDRVEYAGASAGLVESNEADWPGARGAPELTNAKSVSTTVPSEPWNVRLTTEFEVVVLRLVTCPTVCSRPDSSNVLVIATSKFRFS
jgi:hypothetical protein